MVLYRSSFLLGFLLLVVPAASAELAPRWDHSAVDGAGLPPFEYELTPRFPGAKFKQAVHSQPYRLDGQERLLISARFGQIYDGHAQPGPGSPKAVVDLKEPVAKLLGEPAENVRLHLFSTLFDREFPQRRYLFAFTKLVQPGPPRDLILRFKIAGFDPLVLTEATEVISWESDGHDGGDMAWGPQDGMLYLSAGDRSAPGDPNNLGQRVDGIHGSILRIDVGGGERYRVPPDNPFVGIDGVRPEIWAYGLRNPWRMCFHPTRHELWVGDNGDENWEMIHRVEKGSNAGWSAFEGSHIFRAENALAGPTLVHSPAIIQQPHSEMRSVIGGIFYRGEALPELRGCFLYACYFTKRLWAFAYDDGVPGRPFLVADSIGGVVAIEEGADFEPLITTHDGDLYSLKKRLAPTVSRPWPERLSGTGLFTSTGEHQFAAGVYSYTTNASTWSDGAVKQHFVAIAEGPKMKALGGIQLGKSWDLPVGSLLGQTLTIGGIRVETQVLYFDGRWRPYTYAWDEDGADAKLVPEGGAERLVGEQKWRFASRAECMTCHTHRSNFALSLTTRQLDRLNPSGKNQLDEWIRLGLLQASRPLKDERGRPVVDPYGEAGESIAAQARSYLNLNCAHCHRETGLGGRAGFELLESLSLEETGIIDAKPVVGLLGHPGARVVAPGDPANSELLGRMRLRGAGQMPLLGSQVVDEQGVELIRRWIESLGRPDAK
ncbi:MAG: PQQ-dependent sugar dehydrogenase [Verrucomicrobiales bacterium]